MIKLLLPFMALLILIGCSPPSKTTTLVDNAATLETRALYQNLVRLSGKHALFGHQATLAYGYHWAGDSSRSDVKDVTGSFPSLYGWDVADFLPNPSRDNGAIDSARWAQNVGYVKEGLSRGGLITYAWHMRNPVTNRSFYDTTRAVHTILPGGENHETYKETLDQVAAYFKEFDPMPIIFRPFHEHNGDWFWWGKGLAGEDEYIALWRFTVQYLRDEKEVHNILWAFSPDRSRMDIKHFKRDYFYAYPGDEFVDIIGYDNYWDVGHPANNNPPDVQAKDFVHGLSMLAQIADSLAKIPALTETGLEAIPDSLFWTQTLLKALLANEWTRKITYLQVWRNATFERERRDHYYAPFPGQASAADFIKFKESEYILFEDELPDMYSIPKN